MWTLWRGDDRLGTLYERSRPLAPQSLSNEHHVNAVLIPDPIHLPLPSVRQRVVDSGGSRSVIEQMREIEFAGVRSTNSEDDPPEVAFPVSSAKPFPRPVVPRSGQLQVRDHAGETVVTDYITLLEYRVDVTSPPTDLAGLPLGSVLGGTVWLVAFKQAVRAPAT